MLIWLFFLTVPVPHVKPESFSWLQLIGFILLVIGTLVYNEIVIVPWFGFDKNTKKAREHKDKQGTHGISGDEGDRENYMAVSPHAAYDAARNMRKIHMKEEENPTHARLVEHGLNKSEITIEETSHKHQSSRDVESNTSKH